MNKLLSARFLVPAVLITMMLCAGLVLWTIRPSMRLVYQGDRHLEQGNYFAAASSYDLARANEPRQWRAWEGLAYARYKLGNYEGAAEAAQRFADLRPKDPSAWHLLGAASQFRGDFEVAAVAYRKYLELAQDSQIWLELGDVLYRLERYGDAIAALDQAVELDSANADAWLFLGASKLAIGEKADAIHAYERAVEVGDEGEVRYRFYLAQCLIKLDELEDASRVLQSIAQDAPRNHAARCSLAHVQLLLGQVDAALASSREAVGISRCPAAIARLVVSLARAGDIAAAEEAVQQLQQVSPENAALLRPWIHDVREGAPLAPAPPPPALDVICIHAGRP